MGSRSGKPPGYIEVKDRLAGFYADHGDHQVTVSTTWPPFVVDDVVVTDKDHDGRPVDRVVKFLAVHCTVRCGDCGRSGDGVAWERVPGRTPYTEGSEAQNAETSAVGRALVFGGFADALEGIASADEVRNRRVEQAGDPNDERWTQLLDAADPDVSQTLADTFAAMNPGGSFRDLPRDLRDRWVAYARQQIGD